MKTAPRRSTLDLISEVATTPERPLDFTIVLRLNRRLADDAVATGAMSARRKYGPTGSFSTGRSWDWREADVAAGAGSSAATTGDPSAAIRAFVAEPFDLRTSLPVRQLHLAFNGTSTLVSRFHHAAADGLSAALWIGHQLEVALERTAALEAIDFDQAFAAPQLRHHPKPQRMSRYAFGGASDRLWTSGAGPSNNRRWKTISFNNTELKRVARRPGGVTFNDVLVTSMLRACLAWNQQHGEQAEHRIGVWLPTNIRRRPFRGFGNGTGRMRVYGRLETKDTFADHCRNVHQQISWSRAHGEWAVPEDLWITRLPLPLMRLVLRMYINRPGVDMGSTSFSHADRFLAPGSAAYQLIDDVELIGQLHPTYPIGVSGVSLGDTTHLTFTSDAGLFSDEDADGFIEAYQREIDRAEREL